MTCRYFAKYKAIYEPRCGCYACWSKYFETNVGKTAAWIAIMDLHGFAYLEGAKGTQFAKMLQRYTKELKND